MYSGGLYVALGDSTVGSTVTKGTNLYAHRLWKYINETYGLIRFIDKAVGNSTSDSLVNNLPVISQFKPDLVTIGIGMNDCLSGSGIDTARFTDNLNRIIDRLQLMNPNASIVLCTPNRSSNAIHVTAPSYRTAMADVATAKNVGLARFEDAWVDVNTAANTADGIHPNDTGHGLLFDVLLPVVESTASSWLARF